MSDIIFYTNPQSRGRIVHWMLEELAEPYETVWIEYGEEMKGQEYQAINPMGKVPAITHRGVVVTETAAICAHLAASYPEKNLQPAINDGRLADYHRWLFFAAGPLEQATTVMSAGWVVEEERQRSFGFGNYESTINAVELALGKGDFICGDHFTAADVFLGSSLMWGMMFDTIDKREIFEEYVTRLGQRTAWQRSEKINADRIAATT